MHPRNRERPLSKKTEHNINNRRDGFSSSSSDDRSHVVDHFHNQVMYFLCPRLLFFLTVALKDDSVAEESHMYQRVKKDDVQDEAHRARVHVTPARFLGRRPVSAHCKFAPARISNLRPCVRRFFCSVRT